MSFTNDKDNDNYATDKNVWERIKDYIPTDKKIYTKRQINMVSFLL